MPLLDISLLKQQQRLDAEDASEDALLTLYLESAERSASVMLGRTLYATSADIPIEDSYGIAVADYPDVRLAILLLASHYYANREPVVTGTIVSDMPLSVNSLLAPIAILFPEVLPVVTVV